MTEYRWTRRRIELDIDGTGLSLDTLITDGTGDPVVFLHGFGSTKEDYADFVRTADLAERPFVAYDAPGFGRSTVSDTSAVSIEFLVSTADATLRHLGIERSHLVGHSMGGLTALLYADRQPERVSSFVDIEGNLAPEDCFLSRQIRSHNNQNPSDFLTEFANRVYGSDESASALYATRVQHVVDPAVVCGVFESMVDASDHGDLLNRMLALPFPRMFTYGEQNAHLSYLPALRSGGVKLAPISHSGHWPMYSNPVEMWNAIAKFLDAIG